MEISEFPCHSIFGRNLNQSHEAVEPCLIYELHRHHSPSVKFPNDSETHVFALFLAVPLRHPPSPGLKGLMSFYLCILSAWSSVNHFLPQAQHWVGIYLSEILTKIISLPTEHHPVVKKWPSRFWSISYLHRKFGPNCQPSDSALSETWMLS